MSDEAEIRTAEPWYTHWLVWVGVILLLDAIVGERPEMHAAEQKMVVAEISGQDLALIKTGAAEERDNPNREQGWHCLSAWDGSNRSMIDQVRKIMRNPDSFEHDQTRIYPNVNGEHSAWMTFRARNGFGEMSVERVNARIDHDSCRAHLLSDIPGRL